MLVKEVSIQRFADEQFQLGYPESGDDLRGPTDCLDINAELETYDLM